MSEEEKIKYKELCTKRIGDMEKDETIIFVSGLLDEIWDLERRIDKAIEYIKGHTDKLKTIRVPKIDFDYKELLEILGDKE